MPHPRHWKKINFPSPLLLAQLRIPLTNLTVFIDNDPAAVPEIREKADKCTARASRKKRILTGNRQSGKLSESGLPVQEVNGAMKFALAFGLKCN